MRSPESVAIEHARAIGTAYRPAGEWQDWVICPRCNDTGWIGGVHEDWPPAEPTVRLIARELVRICRKFGIEPSHDLVAAAGDEEPTP